MAKKVPGELGPGQITKLNKRLREMNGKDPARAAAELAQLMRRYEIQEWEGVSLSTADAKANESVYFSHVYRASRSLTSPMTPYWGHGEQLFILFTPSVERVLVVTQNLHPAWPSDMAHIGLNVLHRQRPFGAGLLHVRAHRHSLPTKRTVTDTATVDWEYCCGGLKSLTTDHTARLRELENDQTTSIAELRAAMLEIWQECHGPAQASW